MLLHWTYPSTVYPDKRAFAQSGSSACWQYPQDKQVPWIHFTPTWSPIWISSSTRSPLPTITPAPSWPPIKFFLVSSGQSPANIFIRVHSEERGADGNYLYMHEDLNEILKDEMSAWFSMEAKEMEANLCDKHRYTWCLSRLHLDQVLVRGLSCIQLLIFH